MTEIKKFDEWNEVKKKADNDNKLVGFRNRDIFYMKMGENIGFEQNGKGENFVRPIIILKKFNKDMFFGIPLSTKLKSGSFYYEFSFTKRNGEKMTNIALLSQMKLYSSKRLLNQIGTINKDDFEKMKVSFKCLLD